MSRLIDADALRAAVMKILNNSIGGAYDGVYQCLEAINNAPTVEFPEQITIKCDTEEEKQKLLSALRNARVTGVVEEERPQVDITEEQAIDKLHETGWLPRHDKEMTERPQGEWIPVSERLPDKEGEYLVTRADFDSWGICRLSNVIDIAKFDYSYHYNNGFHKAYEVIAWCPMPKPYKEAENE